MGTTALILIGIGVVAIWYAISVYNKLVALRQNRKNAFSGIDVQLKQRTDLIPNLVETVKGYATHEKGTLENVTQARARAMHATNLNERLHAENAVSGALANLLMVTENYPELKANISFQQLQMELGDLENKLAAARRFFNNSTDEYNTYSQQFPAIVVARIFGYGNEEYFTITETERAAPAPKVSFS